MTGIRETVLKAVESVYPAKNLIATDGESPVKECPRCGVCQDDDAERCPRDDATLADGPPGERVLDGKYRLERRLGRGGMGVVYQGTHLALQRAFAVKLLHSEGEDGFAA